MALAIVWTEESKNKKCPKLADAGDVVWILEDGAMPGIQEVIDPRFGFWDLPGPVADWKHLLEEDWDSEFVPDSDEVQLIQFRGLRKRKLDFYEDGKATKAEKDAAKNMVKPPKVSKGKADGATKAKDRIPVGEIEQPTGPSATP